MLGFRNDPDRRLAIAMMPAASTAVRRRRWMRLLTIVAISVFTGPAFVTLRGRGSIATGAAVGATIAFGILAIDEIVDRTALGRALRRLPLAVGGLAVVAAYLAVILPTLTLAYRVDSGVWHLEGIAVGYSIVVTVLFITANRIGRLVGWRVLRNVLLGRYHRPVREDRVFLFLDLAGSTGLAERLGETRVQELIARFYFDIAEPIAAYGGEIYQYRGDEISVSWKLAAGIRDASCVACAFAIRACIAARADWYRRAFGVVPTFRIGLHGGPVVAGEVGDERREIMYFGDTINVAARIEALCKRERRDICISGDLLTRLRLPDAVRATPLGRFQLQGKQLETEIFSLSAAPELESVLESVTREAGA
jgi:adenylate cyclase